MRQQVQCQGTSLQIAGVRGASYWGTTGYCGYTSRETTGILYGVKSNIDVSPIMLIIIR